MDDVGRLIGHVAGVAVHVVARFATLKNVLNNVIVGKVLLTLLYARMVEHWNSFLLCNFDMILDFVLTGEMFLFRRLREIHADS